MGRRKAVVMGIDPGTSGFFAVVDERNGKLLETSKIHKLDNIKLVLSKYKKDYTITLIGFEKVSGSATNSVNTAFKFGKNTGQIEGFLAAQELSEKIIELSPKTWQRALKAQIREVSAKTDSKVVATRLAGRAVRNHNEADAICLAFYCLMIQKGKIEAPEVKETKKKKPPKKEEDIFMHSGKPTEPVPMEETEKPKRKRKTKVEGTALKAEVVEEKPKRKKRVVKKKETVEVDVPVVNDVVWS